MQIEMLTTIAASVAVIVTCAFAWRQLCAMKKQRRADCALRLEEMASSDKYFREASKHLYFNESFSTAKIDEFETAKFLGFFETLGSCVKNKLIEKGIAYELFSSDVLRIFEHRDIKKHIQNARNKDEELYSMLVYLHKTFKEKNPRAPVHFGSRTRERADRDAPRNSG